MNTRLLSGVAFTVLLSAAPAFADEARVEAGVSVDAHGQPLEEHDSATTRTETKVKQNKKKTKTTVKSTTEHDGHSVKQHVDDAEVGVSAKAKAKTTDEEAEAAAAEASATTSDD